MRLFKFLTNVILLISTPLFCAQPHATCTKHAPCKTQNFSDLSYDEMMELLDRIESGEFERTASVQELDQVMDLLQLLAEKGGLPHEHLAWQKDIQANSDSLIFYCVDHNHYEVMAPGLYGNDVATPLCKSWLSKKCKQVKHYIKKHKTAFIIGAAVVIAAAVVLGVVTAASAAVAAAAASSDSQGSEASKPVSSPVPVSTIAAIEENLSSLKEAMVNQTFFQDIPNTENKVSWQEEGRAMGSLLAHQTLQTVEPKAFYQNPDWTSSDFSSYAYGHGTIDQKFSTDYSPLFSSDTHNDFQSLAWELHGDQALKAGCYAQAYQDFDRSIACNPQNPTAYLERGVAAFELGHYENALRDYGTYIAQSPPPSSSLSMLDFTAGFAKGLPQGIYESGEGMMVFLADFVTHPIHTTTQVVQSVSMLVDLARKEEWQLIAENLAPEMHQLVTEWDTLPSDKRGELAGFAVGKHGLDLWGPGALAKIASKSVKVAQELSQICKGFKTAQECLALETAAAIGDASKITEIVQFKTATIAQKLGFNLQEIAQLENIDKLVTNITNVSEKTSNSLQDISFTNHALQRAIERGISKESILDALTSPLKIKEIKIDNLGKPSQRFIGKKAEVVINPNTQQIVSVNPTSTKKLKKLTSESPDVSNRN